VAAVGSSKCVVHIDVRNTPEPFAERRDRLVVGLDLLTLLVLALCAVAFAIDAPGEGSVGSPDQIVNPADWHGTWSANNRYGGQMYTCPQGNRLYGVYSNAGFIIGRIEGRTVEGTWYEGGRGDRNDWQGAFRIELSADNREFDGFYHRVTQDGTELRWREERLGAPWPAQPSKNQCLVPGKEPVLGKFFNNPGPGRESATYALCQDKYDQIYGSFGAPDGFIEGWSVDSSTGFHGYRYDSNGRSGAYILRAVSDTEVRGFYWRGRLARQNIATATEENLSRTSYISHLDECERVGPGFLRRLRGPDNAAGALGLSFAVVVAVIMVLF